MKAWSWEENTHAIRRSSPRNFRAMGFSSRAAGPRGIWRNDHLEEEWSAAQDHIRLLVGCGCQVLVYGECGMMPGGFPSSMSP